MRSELDPRRVADRLSRLKALYVPESVVEGGARLAREQPRSHASLAQVAARSLAELRALCELARVLHMGRRNASPPGTTADDG
jgi:hypothetical protein